MFPIDQTVSPICLNQQVVVLEEAPSGAGTVEKYIIVESESVLASLYAESVSGDLDIKIYTLGLSGQLSEPVLEFPTLTSPTADLLLRQAARTMRVIRVVATYTDSCEFNLTLRGIRAGTASVIIEGAATFEASQIDIDNSGPQVVVASSLDDRKGILVINNSVAGSATLYVGGTMAQAVTGTGTPIRPGGNLTVNLAAGAELYGVSDGTDIDVRISQIG